MYEINSNCTREMRIRAYNIFTSISSSSSSLSYITKACTAATSIKILLQHNRKSLVKYTLNSNSAHSNHIFLLLSLTDLPVTFNWWHLFIQISSYFPSTCVNHFNQSRITIHNTDSSHIQFRNFADVILQLSVMPRIHLIIIPSCFTDQITLPYTKTLWNEAL